MDWTALRLAKGFYYLATPYSKFRGGLDAAHIKACEIAGALIKEGVPVYSPVAHSHPISHYAEIDPYSHDFWMPVCQPMMEAAYGILVCELPGHAESKGMDMEIRWFAMQDRPIIRLSRADLRALVPQSAVVMLG